MWYEGGKGREEEVFVVKVVTIETRHSVCFPYPITCMPLLQCFHPHLNMFVVYPIPLVLVSQLVLKDRADAVGGPGGRVGGRQGQWGRGGGSHCGDQRSSLREKCSLSLGKQSYFPLIVENGKRACIFISNDIVP